MNSPNFAQLLQEAITQPGRILEAYSAFHSYSFGNQLLAASQLVAREIPLGPINTFKGWERLGRKVSKGSKAIELCVPVPISFEKENAETGESETLSFTRFKLKKGWFSLAQTEGPDVPPLEVPAWTKDQALKTLEISVVPFDHLDGNVQGYALGKTIAINPLAQLPIKTLFHEMGHLVLGHQDRSEHAENLPRSLKEVEAESVAFLCLSALELPGGEYCRGYIQSWMDSDGIPEKSAQKIMNAADKILKAGAK